MGSEPRIVVAEAEPYRLPLTVSDFLILDEAGAFEEVGRVELIDGEIFKMAPMHRPHARTVPLLWSALDIAIRAARLSLEAMTEPSAKLDAHNLPQADIVVADIIDEDWVSPEAVRVLIEVADSSLAHDLGRKLRLYARTGVPEYWVADITNRVIIRLHAPSDDTYTERAEFAFGEAIPSATIPGLTVDTARLA